VIEVTTPVKVADVIVVGACRHEVVGRLDLGLAADVRARRHADRIGDRCRC
jgi:hypothetical protein